MPHSTKAMLDQALFASVQSVSNEGYQLAARSPGIDDGTCRELSAGPDA